MDERRELSAELLESRAWKELLLPYFQNQIKKYSNIKKIDTNNIEVSYHKNKIRVEIFTSLINSIISWSKTEEEYGRNK